MFKYFISKEFFITLLGLTVLGVMLYLLTFFVILPIYTKHGDSVLVPDVQGMSIIEAEKALKGASLRSEAKDSTYMEEFSPLAIVDQYPGPHSAVKPDRKIFLTINKSSAPMVKVPNIIYNSGSVKLFQAKNTLESFRLKVGTVSSRPDATAKGYVLEMLLDGKKVRPGDMLPQGTSIDLVTSSGAGNVWQRTPSLLGLTVEEATTLLEDHGLSMGTPVFGETTFSETTTEREVENGQIFRQDPMDSIRAGGAVDVWIKGE